MWIASLPVWCQRLFPRSTREFAGKRAVKIALRTVHLVGVAGIGGGFLYGAEMDAWRGYLYLTLLSGVAMMALEIWSNGIWLLQLRGMAVIVKLIALAAMTVTPDLEAPLFLAIVVISGVIAHAPGDVRYFSIWRWRRMDSLYEESG